jgi:hypothetical protein
MRGDPLLAEHYRIAMRVPYGTGLFDGYDTATYYTHDNPAEAYQQTSSNDPRNSKVVTGAADTGTLVREIRHDLERILAAWRFSTPEAQDAAAWRSSRRIASTNVRVGGVVFSRSGRSANIAYIALY